MPISVTDGSGQLIKTNCKYLCEGSRDLDTPPTTEDWAQHPALNIAMDGIAIYANWVSRIVMPIAFLWIDEHKEEICAYEHWDKLPDDVNEVVNAAFEIAKEQHYYKDGRIAFYDFQQEVKGSKFKTENINPNWTEKSKELRAEMHRQFHIPGRMNKVPPVAV